MKTNYKMMLKIGAVVFPVVLGILSAYFGDVQPMIRDVCGSLLPAGSVVPTFPLPVHEVDAGAAR